jgi:hypothetical protein
MLAFVFVLLVCSAKSQYSRIDEKGSSLKHFYHSLHVEDLWIAGHHINWETGQADNPNAEHGIHTHCSAFAAAACKRLHIYILRPPEHGQLLLAMPNSIGFLPRRPGATDGCQLPEDLFMGRHKDWPIEAMLSWPFIKIRTPRFRAMWPW